ncbi:hypothetical protein HGRIS_001465 [Hohenbuehelia grisea]|uniref:Uncharacterized protein n=1 Tax=Hohenbuehelia grisea TaxID=104357 RepID=A0ABR3J0Q8_9AGAR
MHFGNELANVVLLTGGFAGFPPPGACDRRALWKDMHDDALVLITLAMKDQFHYKKLYNEFYMKSSTFMTLLRMEKIDSSVAREIYAHRKNETEPNIAVVFRMQNKTGAPLDHSWLLFYLSDIDTLDATALGTQESALDALRVAVNNKSDNGLEIKTEKLRRAALRRDKAKAQAGKAGDKN